MQFQQQQQHALAPLAPAPAPQPPRPRKAPRIKRTLRSLLTPEQLNLAIQRESLRVDRKEDSSLVLLLFRFAGDVNAPSTMRLAKTILHRIRVTDDIGWFDEQHLGVLLPDTAPAGAWRLAQQICDRVARRAPRPHIVMYCYPGNLVTEDGASSVIRQTDERMIPEAKAG
jgi:hypothetical protein